MKPGFRSGLPSEAEPSSAWLRAGRPKLEEHRQASRKQGGGDRAASGPFYRRMRCGHAGMDLDTPGAAALLDECGGLLQASERLGLGFRHDWAIP
jgi:hypothetical protein